MTDTKTEPLYQKDGTLYTHTTTLTSISPLTSLPPSHQSFFKPPQQEGEVEAEAYILTTPSTIFHAQGGGQPSDTGSITLTTPTASGLDPKFSVRQVRKIESTPAILHMGVFEPPDVVLSAQEVGLEVEQCIDVATRVLHSRLHTAGHVVGLAIHLLNVSGVLDGPLRGGKASHYPGAALVEHVGLIPGEKKEAVQAKVDELVARDLSVHIHFWSEAEARRRCIDGVEGAAIEGAEEVRVVDIGGLGSYPCGGTHVGSLKELGRVVVRSIRRQKGITKVGYNVEDA